MPPPSGCALDATPISRRADAHDEADLARRRARAELEAAGDRARRAGERVEQLDVEGSQLRDELAGAKAAPAPTPASDELAELQRAADAARERRDARAAERDAARERWSTTRGAAELAETRISDRRRERAVAEARVAQLEASLPNAYGPGRSRRASATGWPTSCEAAREADAGAEATHASAEVARGERRSELLDLERAQGGTSSRLGELERAAQSTAIEASRRDESLAALGRERELALDGLPASEIEIPTDEIDALDDEELEVELRRARRMLSQIGSVNPFAVEEHRELARGSRR